MCAARPAVQGRPRRAKPATPKPDPKEAIRGRALDLGFDIVRCCDADLSQEAAGHLDEYLKRSYHGDMAWMASTGGRRRHPRSLWPDARSAIIVGPVLRPW